MIGWDRGKRKGELPRSRRIVRRTTKILIGVLVVALVAGLVTAFYLKNRFEGNIDEENFISEEITGVKRPVKLPEVKGTLNVLVMGSDTRAGANGKGIGGDSSATPGLSDTTILLHLSEDRTFAYGVSIPRDSMVERPPCPEKDGEGIDPGGFTQFNEAFAVGGPACTVATVEANTGVRIDNFVVIDFAGFRKMVDAIGGVEMCVPEEVNDSIGKIYLDAGTYNMDGNTALAYVRVRHGIGAELGDIGRIKRQQVFISAMIEKVMSAGTLANPVKLVSLLEAATKSLTTDPGLADLRKLAGLASSLQDIGMKKIKFITVPFELWPEDPNKVIWSSSAEGLWDRIKKDENLTPDLGDQGVSPTTGGKKQDAGVAKSEKSAYGLC